MHQYVANRNVFRDCLKLFPPIIGLRKLSGKEFQTNSHQTIFTTLGEMSDVDKIINPQHFGSDLADIRIRINPEMRIRLPDHFRLGEGLRSLSTI